MRPISEIKANYRLRVVSSGEDGFAAYINHPCYKPTAIAVIASWRAANPPEGSTAVINALSPGLAAMMPTATKQARKKLLTLQQVRKRLAELIEKEYQHE